MDIGIEKSNSVRFNRFCFFSCKETENYMKLTIAFLQLLPVGSLKGNMEKGIKACFQAKEKGADMGIQKPPSGTVWRNIG